MPYVFAFLVAVNAGFAGYQLLKSQDGSTLPPIHLITSKDFSKELELVKGE